MRLKLQNIGIIEEADINVDGITLIAGQNDSGKSTVGKVLYAIIKGFNQDERLFEEEKNKRIVSLYQDIIKEIKNNKNVDINEYLTKEIIDSWTQKIERILTLDILTNESKVFIEASLMDLKNYINAKHNTILQKELEIHNWLYSEIKTRRNIFRGNAISKFEIEDLEGKATIKNEEFDSYHDIELDNNLDIYYKEAYFIESPLVIDDQLRRFVGSETFQHFTRSRQDELLKALANPAIAKISSFDHSKIYKEISEIINGEITVDFLNGVRYNKKNQEIAIKNTAVGIKSFGLIQLLLKNNRLNNRSLLIIDEPEVHLHPTWQVKYAEILVRLSKEFAIPIVLTSHSPYFIEALEAFVKKYKYEKSTNFYFAEKNKDGLSAKIIDVTKNISPILSSISEAFYTIQDLNDED
jgi:predicted ATPase